MLDQLIPLFVGFLLTTVLGGILGYYFQNRSWKHQNNASLLEMELQTALKVFEDVSKLMDKRLYRMRLLYWRLDDDQSTEEAVESHLNYYRDILFEWNDNLNRNLALIQCYFGNNIRKQIDYAVYEQFKEIGNLLEEAYRKRKSETTATNLTSLQNKLETLSDEIYHLNIQMIALIQQRQIGLFNHDRTGEATK